MAWLVKGGTSFNIEALKGADLEKLIEDHKGIVAAEHVKAAWDEANPKVKAPKKGK